MSATCAHPVGQGIEEAVLRWLPATLLAVSRASERWTVAVGVATSFVFAFAHVIGSPYGLPLGQFVAWLVLWRTQRRSGLVGSIALHAAFKALILGLVRSLG